MVFSGLIPCEDNTTCELPTRALSSVHLRENRQGSGCPQSGRSGLLPVGAGYAAGKRHQACGHLYYWDPHQ